jgi:hypothetical protein
LDLKCCHSSVFGHVVNIIFKLPVEPVKKEKLSDFIFYWTRLTGFTGYFFGFPDESQKFQSPSANEKITGI